MATSARSEPAAHADACAGSAACHHCGGDLGRRPLAVTVGGKAVRVCGEACRTAVEAIAGAGLDAWYRLRAHPDADGAHTADSRYRAEADAWRVPEVAAAHLRPAPGGRNDVALTVQGMRCAGCAWLVEHLLCAAPGVSRASVDLPLRRAEVRFDPRVTRLHTLLETLAGAGYRAAPYSAHTEEAVIEDERRDRIRGLGIAAVFGMQVMLLSIALYASGASGAAGHHGGMDPRLETTFRWLAMLLTVPVLAWPGRSFFNGAAAALRARRLTMDVPVALGLALAFAGSAYATVTGEGEIWFDSVVMFVALLGGARYLELVARRRATATVRSLARSAPLVAARIDRREEGDGAGEVSEERVPAAALRPGDRIRVRPGEIVPADGVIRSGCSAFDESLLTGESEPVVRPAGGPVLAGSVNGPGTVEVDVTSAGDETVLGGVLRRAEEAARARPAIALLADRVAGWFIAGVLVLAGGVAAAWLLHDPTRAVAVVVSVLVVTCPCALSLATPAAMTAALGALARAGIVATRANAVERLALATHCLADKTGTLTEGRFRLESVSTPGGLPAARCIELAAALERHASHPAGAAIVAAAAPGGEHGGGGNGTVRLAAPGRETRDPDEGPRIRVEDPEAGIGGVAGRIAGVRHAVGSAPFVAGACRLAPEVLTGETAGDAAPSTAAEGGRGSGSPCATAESEGSDGKAGTGTRVFLARDGVLLARFLLADSVRPGTRALVAGLRARGIETTVASGDAPGPVDRAAEAVGIPRRRRLAGLSPVDKLEEAHRLAAEGERVLMLGDGVNDAPALAGAHVSVAMGRGAAAAASRADAVLLGDDPRALLAGIDTARRARRIVKQNLAWALAYNLVALPLAATGAVPPWAAAIGMSLSSLAVVGNALRLAPGRGRNGNRGSSPADPERR